MTLFEPSQTATMKNLIQVRLADAVSMDIPSHVVREFLLPQIPNKAFAVIGMRRTGKTYFLYQLMGHLLHLGIDRSQLVYFNFEDERFADLSVKDLHWIPDEYYAMFPENRDATVYFFFDEIQLIDGWEKFVRRLMDSENVEIYLSGSSAKMLSREIATSMRGRSVDVTVFPYSYSEFLENQGIQAPAAKSGFNKKMRSLLENQLLKYLLCGGFPEAQGLSTFDRNLLLQGYVNTVMFRDIVDRYRVTNIGVLKKLIRHLIRNDAAKFTVNKFYNQLKSQGVKVSKTTLHDYLDHLRDAFLLQTVPISTESERKRMVNPVKSYVIDTGLAVSFSISREQDIGRLLENCVFMQLCRRYAQVTYLVTESGYEVDFVARYHDGRREVIQVAADISVPKTREREIRALLEAAQATPDADLLLLTMREEETIDHGLRPIHIVPAWKWLLNDLVQKKHGVSV